MMMMMMMMMSYSISCGVIVSDLSTFAQRSKVRFDAQSAGDEGDANSDTADRCTRT